MQSVKSMSMRQTQRGTGGRYLRYDAAWGARYGLEHATTNLKCLLMEAASIGRLAVVGAPRLSPHHNANIEIDWRWETYFDLSAGRLVDLQTGAWQAIPVAKRPPCEFCTTLTLSRRQRVPRWAGSIELIVRRVHPFNPFSLPGSVRIRSKRLWLPPSAAATDLARPAIEVLRRAPQGYVALHIRRGDRLRNDRRWANATTPERVRAKLRQHGVERDTPVYILSDERDPAFWAALRGCCRMYRYQDFPHLAAVVAPPDGGRPDNYLLFVAEREIMQHARLRIGTTFGPERPPADDWLDKGMGGRNLRRLRRRAVGKLRQVARAGTRALRHMRA